MTRVYQVRMGKWRVAVKFEGRRISKVGTNIAGLGKATMGFVRNLPRYDLPHDHLKTGIMPRSVVQVDVVSGYVEASRPKGYILTERPQSFIGIDVWESAADKTKKTKAPSWDESFGRIMDGIWELNESKQPLTGIQFLKLAWKHFFGKSN